MSTYTQIIYQIVFSPKRRAPVLLKKNRDILYKYISGILKNKDCIVFCINGIEDHIHILTHIHPSVSLASLVKDIKIASSFFIKHEKLFPGFEGWQTGYSAFTYSIREKDMLVRYVENQEAHHHKKTYKEEYIELLKENGVEFDERYFL